MAKRLNNFKTFESNDVKVLTQKEIEEIFIELMDMGYVPKFFTKHYFEFKKTIDNPFGYIDKGNAYGFTDILKVKKEFDGILDIIDESKHRLNSMGFTIGFEMECSLDTYIVITCHVQDSKYDESGDDSNRNDNLGSLGLN